MLVCGRDISDSVVRTVHIRDGRIVELTDGVVANAIGGADVWLAPGFHDIQVNGYGGHDFNDGAWGLPPTTTDDLLQLQDALAAHGTALFCPTVITAELDIMARNLRRIARAMERSRTFRMGVTGIHLEGPFISPEDGPRGAHPLEHVREPDPGAFQRLQDAAAGHIRICTLAPERPGALHFIEMLVEHGIVAAIGHTGAPAAVIRDAITAGATLSTHLGNGCHALIPRHDSYLWEQLACDRLTASFIVDGHHLEPAAARVFVRAKGPQRTILISDAVGLAGMPPGVYDDGRFTVRSDGSVALSGTPYLAGAGFLLDTCIPNACQWCGLTLADAVGCVTTIPARLLRLPDKGRIAVGADADLTLFMTDTNGRDPAKLTVLATITSGEVLYRRG